MYINSKHDIWNEYTFNGCWNFLSTTLLNINDLKSFNNVGLNTYEYAAIFMLHGRNTFETFLTNIIA